MKIGLVLEGGGMRTLFTAGVLDAFLDKHIEVNGGCWCICWSIIWCKLYI